MVARASEEKGEDGVYRLLTRGLFGKLAKRGWEAVPGLLRTIANPKGGWMILWLAVTPPGKSSYDRPQFVIDPSVIVVTKDDQSRIGFIETMRTHRPRPSQFLRPMEGLGYVARLIKEKGVRELLRGTPKLSIELPAGNVDINDFAGFVAVVDIGVNFVAGFEQVYEERYLYALKNAAKRESGEETGLEVEVVDVLVDALNPNTAWFMHADSVAVTRYVKAGYQKLDPTEMPKRLLWYTEEEIRKLIRERRIFDARTIAALALAGVRVN